MRKKKNVVNLTASDLEYGKMYTYKDMCTILGERVEAGNSKIAQLSRWSERYDLERVEGTHYYLVKDIYDIPLEDCTPVGKKNDYMDSICNILFMLCYDNRMNCLYDKFYSFTTSKSHLYVLLGLCQTTFLERAYHNNPELEKDFKEHPKMLAQFQNEVFGKCAGILKSARMAMKRRNLINSKEVLEFASLDESGRYWEWYEVGIGEENKLMECKRRALSAMGYSYETEVYNNRKEDEFRKMVLENMKKYYDIDIIAYRHGITFWANKMRVNKFVDQNFDGDKEDIITFKEFTLNAAMEGNNDKFMRWLGERDNINWDKMTNEEIRKNKEESAWKVWDDILLEIYQDDIEKEREKYIAGDIEKPKIWTIPEYNEIGKEKYNTLRNMMKEKYVELPAR